jgi:hypothetical protein
MVVLPVKSGINYVCLLITSNQLLQAHKIDMALLARCIGVFRFHGYQAVLVLCIG